jgi:DNA-binding CsgD family transcriptional regulator
MAYRKFIFITLHFLFVFLNAKGQDIEFVNMESSWKFSFEENNSKQWLQPSFEDRGWQTSILYYNKRDLNAIKDSARTIFLRTSFNTDIGKEFTQLILKVKYRNLVNVYLNGQQVFAHEQAAVSKAKQIEVLQNYGAKGATIKLPTKLLRKKNNILGIETNSILHSAKQTKIVLKLALFADTLKSGVLIKRGTNWQYWDNSNSPGYDWFYGSFSDQNWKNGVAPLGYGDGEAITVLDYGKNILSKTRVYYFRKQFSLKESDQYLGYLLKIRRDDGAIVYINNKEVTRTNLPEGLLDSSSLANYSIAGPDELFFNSILLHPHHFVQGSNTIAVAVFQHQPNSSDLIFDLELVGINNPSVIYSLLQDSSEISSIKENFRDLTERFEVGQKTIEAELSAKDLYYHKLFLYPLLGILVFMVLLVLYLIQEKKATEKRLTSQVTDNITQLNQKKRELLTANMALTEKGNIIEELRKDIEKIEPIGNSNQSQHLKTIKSKILESKLQDNEWETIKIHFNQVYSGFIEAISFNFPHLTQSELRLCCYIKMQLSTKEIARILSIDPRSVQSARYRLKKKMKLDQNEDLITYILEYGIDLD